MLAILLSLVVCLPIDDSRVVCEQVDLIELNHFYDECGRAVYDQVIFYEWSASQAKYHVRAWVLVEAKDIVSKRPIEHTADNSYRVGWFDEDQNFGREIKSKLFRETWTQTDPERTNKKILDERNRVALIKRNEPISPSELPAQQSANADNVWEVGQ